MSHSVLLHVVLSWAEDPCSEQTEGPDIGPETQPLLSDTHRQCCYDLEEEGEAWAGSEIPLGFLQSSSGPPNTWHHQPAGEAQALHFSKCVIGKEVFMRVANSVL